MHLFMMESIHENNHLEISVWVRRIIVYTSREFVIGQLGLHGLHA